MIAKLATIALTLFIVACAQHGSSFENSQSASSVVLATSYKSGDRIASALNKVLPTTRPIMKTTFVDINNIEKSSTLGRISSEQIASRLVQHGFPIVEPKMRQTIGIIPQTGEIMLSQDVRKIAQESEIDAVLVGYYTISAPFIYMSVRVIGVPDNAIIAADDYVLERGRETNSLLW